MTKNCPARLWAASLVGVVLGAIAVVFGEWLILLSLGEPRVVMPESARARVGEIVQIKWSAPGEARWFVYHGPTSPNLIVHDRLTLFAAGTPGEYVIAAYTARNGTPSELSFCTVTVSNEPAPGPLPPPGPGPKPPPIDPTDPLFLSLKAAWEKEPTASRDLYRPMLVSAYREIAQLVLDERYANVGELADAIHVAADARLAKTALAGVRRVAGDYANTQLPRTPATKLDTAIRAKASECYYRLARLVEAL